MEGWAGRGTVPEERDRDSGWAAEEWAEVGAGREVRGRAAEERELEARAREVRVPAAAVCGKAAPGVAGPVAGRVPAAGREAELGPGRVVRVAGPAPAEAGERERVAGRAEVGLAQVLDLEARGLAEVEQVLAGVVRVAGLERAEEELDRVERERREDGRLLRRCCVEKRAADMGRPEWAEAAGSPLKKKTCGRCWDCLRRWEKRGKIRIRGWTCRHFNRG